MLPYVKNGSLPLPPQQGSGMEQVFQSNTEHFEKQKQETPMFGVYWFIILIFFFSVNSAPMPLTSIFLQRSRCLEIKQKHKTEHCDCCLTFWLIVGTDLSVI